MPANGGRPGLAGKPRQTLEVTFFVPRERVDDMQQALRDFADLFRLERTHERAADSEMTFLDDIRFGRQLFQRHLRAASLSSDTWSGRRLCGAYFHLGVLAKDRADAKAEGKAKNEGSLHTSNRRQPASPVKRQKGPRMANSNRQRGNSKFQTPRSLEVGVWRFLSPGDDRSPNPGRSRERLQSPRPPAPWSLPRDVRNPCGR